MKIVRTLSLSLSGLTALLTAIPAFASEMPGMADTGGMSVDHLLFLGVDVLNLAMIAASVIILALVIGRYGASELSTIFSSFIVAALLLGACRLFIVFVNNGIIHISDDGMAMGWHIIFYLAMITFIMGARSLVTLSKEGQSAVTNKIILIWSVIVAVVTLLVFIFAAQIDEAYMKIFGGTALEAFGIIHFIAFLLAGIAAFYVFQRTKVGAVTKVLSTPLLIAIGFMSLQHLWELLVESWKVIPIPSSMIEQVELIFVVPSYVLFAFAFLRLYRLVSRSAA
ncbi:MAG: hypothetical protein JWM56_630 [Candidatus Peribacteria bacterium]|nr:hypothetical protein [Candidatus Peribacteria bacterium]